MYFHGSISISVKDAAKISQYTRNTFGFAKILPTCFRQAGVKPGFTRIKTDSFSTPQNNMAMLSYVRFNHDLNINL